MGISSWWSYNLSPVYYTAGRPFLLQSLSMFSFWDAALCWFPSTSLTSLFHLLCWLFPFCLLLTTELPEPLPGSPFPSISLRQSNWCCGVTFHICAHDSKIYISKAKLLSENIISPLHLPLLSHFMCSLFFHNCVDTSFMLLLIYKPLKSKDP